MVSQLGQIEPDEELEMVLDDGHRMLRKGNHLTDAVQIAEVERGVEMKFETRAALADVGSSGQKIQTFVDGSEHQRQVAGSKHQNEAAGSKHQRFQTETKHQLEVVETKHRHLM